MGVVQIFCPTIRVLRRDLVSGEHPPSAIPPFYPITRRAQELGPAAFAARVALLEQVTAIISEDVDFLHSLCAIERRSCEKSEQADNRLGETLTHLRRAPLIRWDAIQMTAGNCIPVVVELIRPPARAVPAASSNILSRSPGRTTCASRNRCRGGWRPQVERVAVAD